jgi:hypothetical protein
MSRGLGKTQRFVLGRLRELREQGDVRHHTAYALAASLIGDAVPSPSAVQSIRQAIRRLEERGLVETAQLWGRAEGRPPRIEHLPHRHPMASRIVIETPDRMMLGARLPLAEAEAAQEAKRYEAAFPNRAR